MYCLPSVLWRCWLGGRKGIRPVKNRVVGYGRGYLSGAGCRLAWCHCHTLSLAPVKSRLVLRYDTRCYFNVRSKADISQLNLPNLVPATGRGEVVRYNGPCGGMPCRFLQRTTHDARKHGFETSPETKALPRYHSEQFRNTGKSVTAASTCAGRRPYTAWFRLHPPARLAESFA